MWEQYRKTLIPIQAIILTVCLIMYFFARVPWQSIIMFFFTMQFCSFMGARWAIRLKHKVANSRDQLPVKPKF